MEQHAASGAVTRAPMTATEARELTNRINQTAGKLWRLLLESYEREAWRALGYASWREYATAEFTISKSRAYQILDQGRVIAAITEAARLSADEDFSTMVEIPERAAREIKPMLPEVTEQVRERVEAGEEPESAVRDVIEEARGAKREPPKPAAAREPEPDQPDDDDVFDVDPVAEWERAEKRVEELESLVASLKSSDLAGEVVEWRQKYAQLEGRLQREITTRNEAERTARYAQKKLAEVRKELGIERDRDIIPAIQALRQWAAA